MGVSTDGIIFYGYDLGDDFAFEVDEDADEDQDYPDWYDEDEGWEGSAMKKLLTEIGFTETDWRAEGYFDRQREAEARVGVKFDTHCSDEYPCYLVGAVVISASRGNPKAVDLTLPDNADERLAWAIGVLGLKPTAEKPQWLLASYWG